MGWGPGGGGWGGGLLLGGLCLNGNRARLLASPTPPDPQPL